MPLPRFHKLSEEKQSELLDAAAQELAEKGLDGASIAAVVERAGASRSAVYYYFEDKDDLFRTVLQQRMRDAMALVGEPSENELREDLWGTVRRHKKTIIRHFLQRPTDIAIWRMAFAQANALNTHPVCISDMYENLQQHWRYMVRCGQEGGTVRTDMPLDLCVDLIFAIDGVMHRRIAEIDVSDLDAIDTHIDRSIDMFRRLLDPAEGNCK